MEVSDPSTRRAGRRLQGSTDLVSMLDVRAREGCRTDDPECHHVAHAKTGHQAQPPWVCERQVLLSQPDLLLRQDNLLSG